MAEPRRIAFETVRSLSKEKKPKEVQPTYRFSLVLGETNDNTCPEYSYSELVKTARGAEQQNTPLPSEDPYGDGDDDDEKLREIARKFEEKYGPKVEKKKKKKLGKWEDYIDRGMGYDETDPFIDNEEAYDELVPSTLTTQYGGFYINFGELEFKNLSDSESDDFQDEKKLKRKRKKHKEGGEKEAKRKRKNKDGDHSQRKRGRKPLEKSLSALSKPKKRGQTTVADLLQQQRLQQQQQQSQQPQQQPQQQQQPLQVQQQLPPTLQPQVQPQLQPQCEEIVAMEEHIEIPSPACSSPVKPSGESSGEGATMPQLQPTTTPTTSVPTIATVRDVIEAVIKGAGGAPVNNGNATATMSSSSSDSEGNANYVVESIDAPKLPENLPSDLGDVVTKLKQAAFMSDEGKCKFFSGDVNKMLLRIEMMSRELPCTHRSMIFAHLASYLPCTKETLLKRAKKLRLDQEDGKLYAPMQRLRNAVMEIMPEMIAKYASACQTVAESKPSEGGKDEEKAGSGSDDGDDSDANEGEKSSLLPKKKFEWNDEIRELLCEVVRIKLKCYEVMKMRTQSAEEYLRQFLDAEVKALWPPGWMHAKILYRESRSVHAHMTCKPKKAFLLPKKLVMPSLPSTPKPAVGSLSPLPLVAESPTDITVPSMSAKSVITQVSSTPQPSLVVSTDTSAVIQGASSLDPSALINSVAQATSVITSAVQSCLGAVESPDILPAASKLASVTVSVVANPQASLQESLPARMESAIKMEQAKKQDTALKAEQNKRQDVGIKTEQSKKTESFSDSVTVVSPEKPRSSPCVTSSPNKHFFSLINPNEAAAQMQAPKVSPHSSIASQMLDRIICASLGNFPNSSTSGAADGSSLSSRILGSSSEFHPSAQKAATSTTPLSLGVSSSKHAASELKTPSSYRTDAQKSSPSSLASATSGISILKKAYASSQSSQANHRTKEEASRPPASTLSFARSSVSPATSAPTTHSSASKAKQASPAIPHMRYGFEEAFLKTLEGLTSSSSSSQHTSAAPATPSAPSKISSLPKYDLQEESAASVREEPVNFSSPRTTNVVANSQYGSHERLRYVGSTPTSVLNVASDKSRTSSSYTVPYSLSQIRTTRTSPDVQESKGGFAHPSSSSAQSVVRFPPPAHSSYSTPRLQQQDNVPASQCHSSSQSSSQPLLTTSVTSHCQTPLTHYTPETPHTSRHLVQSPWRGSTPSPTSNYQSHTPYSSSSAHPSDSSAYVRTSPSGGGTTHIQSHSPSSHSPTSHSSPQKATLSQSSYIHGTGTVVTLTHVQQPHRSTSYTSSQQYSSSASIGQKEANLHQSEGSSQQLTRQQHLQ